MALGVGSTSRCDPVLPWRALFSSDEILFRSDSCRWCCGPCDFKKPCESLQFCRSGRDSLDRGRGIHCVLHRKATQRIIGMAARHGGKSKKALELFTTGQLVFSFARKTALSKNTQSSA